MFIQHQTTNRVFYNGQPMPSRQQIFKTEGYRCCCFRCNGNINAIVTTDDILLLEHRIEAKKFKGPVDHKKAYKMGIRAYEAYLNCRSVKGRCPVCRCVTLDSVLLDKPQVVFFDNCLVLTDKDVRIVIFFLNVYKSQSSAHFDTLLGPMKNTHMTDIAKLTALSHADLIKPSQIPCKKHSVYLEYPLTVFTKYCTRCKADHGAVSVSNTSYKRHIASYLIRDIYCNPMEYFVWSIPFDDSDPTPMKLNAPPKGYSNEDRTHWFFYSEQTLHPTKRSFFENNVLLNKVHILVRPPKRSFKQGTRFCMQDPIQELCPTCIHIQSQSDPCCRMCLNKNTINKTTGYCAICQSIFFSLPTKELQNSNNNGDIPEIINPSFSRETNLLVALDRGVDNWTAAMDDMDNFLRCCTCSTISLSRFMFSVDKKSIKAECINSILILESMDSQTLVCMGCVKKCTQCNNMLYIKDAMSKCARCRLGRANKRKFSSFSKNIICQSMTLSGDAI